MNAIVHATSPLEQFRGEAERRADHFELYGERRAAYVDTAMRALAVEAFNRDMEPMRRAVARLMLDMLPTGIVIGTDGSMTPMRPSTVSQQAMDALRECSEVVARSYGLTPAPDGAPPPTSPPAAGSSR